MDLWGICYSRLIVVAEKAVVYEKFPIPLINRLEKHFLTMATILDDLQKELLKDLEKWVEAFSCGYGTSENGKWENEGLKRLRCVCTKHDYQNDMKNECIFYRM